MSKHKQQSKRRKQAANPAPLLGPPIFCSGTHQLHKTAGSVQRKKWLCKPVLSYDTALCIQMSSPFLLTCCCFLPFEQLLLLLGKQKQMGSRRQHCTHVSHIYTYVGVRVLDFKLPGSSPLTFSMSGSRCPTYGARNHPVCMTTCATVCGPCLTRALSGTCISSVLCSSPAPRLHLSIPSLACVNGALFHVLSVLHPMRRIFRIHLLLLLYHVWRLRLKLRSV